MSEADIDPQLDERILDAARDGVRVRLRTACDEQREGTRHDGGDDRAEIDPATLEEMVDEAIEDGDGPIWRIALAQAIAAELAIAVPAALEHPAMAAALARLRERRSAVSEPPPLDAGSEREPERMVTSDETPPGNGRTERRSNVRSLRFGAVHAYGIETLAPGDPDIELRLSEVGLDVLRSSTSEIIGRLRWDEIELVDLQRGRRGFGARRRSAQLKVSTARGEATFELPDLSDDEIADHLEPLLARHAPS